jgi:hypothetical protein
MKRIFYPKNEKSVKDSKFVVSAVNVARRTEARMALERAEPKNDQEQL